MRAALFAVLLVACKSNDAPPPAPSPGTASAAPVLADAATDRPSMITDEMAATTDEVVAAMTRLADALVAQKADCKAAAKTFEASYPEAQRLAGKADTVRAVRDDPAARQWFERTYKTRFESAMNKMLDVAMTCQDSPEYLRAMENYPLVERQEQR